MANSAVHSRRWISMVSVMGTIFLTSELSAQSMRVASVVSANSASANRVTLNVEQAPLVTVLLSIAKQAGLSPVYEPSLIPASTRVTLQLDRVSVADAFEKALSGTGLVARIRSEGDVAIVRNPMASQATGTVTGRVVNAKTGRPMPNATVSLDGAVKGVVTGDDGTFRLPAAVGTHIVHVKAIGFTRQSKSVTVSDAQSAVLEFALEPGTSVLDEVIVTGTVVATERKAIPTPITVITAADIEKRNITHIDQLFRGEVPGVLAMEKGTTAYGNFALGSMTTSTIYARGASNLNGEGTPMKTYIDGVELLDSRYLGTIDPSSIERIEIVTGPQAATLYGSGALSGVMQIFTKKGSGRTSPDLTLNLKYGMLQNNFSNGITPSHSDALLMAGGTGPEFTYSGNVSYQYTGQWQPDLYNRSVGASVGAAHARGRINLSASASVTEDANGTAGCGVTCNGVGGLFVGSILGRRNGSYDGTNNLGAHNAKYITQQVQTASSQVIGLNLDVRPTTFWQHHLVVGRSQTNLALRPLDPSYATIADSLFVARAENGQRTTANYNTTLISQVGAIAATITVGGNGSWGERINITGCKISKAASGYVDCNSFTPLAISSPYGDNNWGGFGSAQLGFFQSLFITASLRGERNQNYGSEHPVDWSPTIGASYTLEAGDITLKLLSSFGRATRPPTLAQRQSRIDKNDLSVPNTYIGQVDAPLLRPEVSLGTQGGFELYYGNLGSFTLNRYVQRITDLIIPVGVDSLFLDFPCCSFQTWMPIYQSQNAAKMRQNGWAGTGSLNLGAVSLKGTYSVDDSRVTSNGLATGTCTTCNQVFQYVPTHTGNVTVGYARGGTSFTYALNYIGSIVGTYVYENKLAWYDQQTNRLQVYRGRWNWNNGIPCCTVIPGYAKSDLAVSQRIRPWASATLNVTNLENSGRSDFSQIFPSLGRQTLVGVSLRYPTNR